MKYSISTRIRRALVGSMSMLAIFAIIILSINQLFALQNKQIIETMTMEYSIISLSDKLVASYNNVVKNQGTAGIIKQYKATHSELLTTIATLDTRITHKESKLLMVGVKNTVNLVMKECDMGLNEVQNNNFQNFSEHFSQAHKYNEYVLNNVRELLQKELEYLSQTQTKSQQIYLSSLSISLFLFIILFVLMVYYARIFSSQLITPLTHLSTFAEDVANGTLQGPIKRDEAISHDEVGSLTKSIYTMVDKLTDMLNKIQLSAEEMKKNNDIIAQNNEDLQKMNALMVGRELKMIELKKEIEALKQKVEKASVS